VQPDGLPRGQHDAVELELQLLDVGVRGQLAGGDGHPELPAHVLRPRRQRGEDGVADGARAAVELDGDRGQEAAGGAVRPGDGVDPLAEGPEEPVDARARADRALGHPLPEPVGGLGDGGQLQGLLGAEVPDHAGLAHAEVGGEPADRDALQPVDGGQREGPVDDAGPGGGGLDDGLAGAHRPSLTYRSFAKCVRSFGS
jgi:hypothetical protein